MSVLWHNPLLLFLTFFSLVNSNELNLIKSYFKEKSIKHATIFTCQELNERQSLMKDLVKLRNPPTTIINLRKENIFKSLNINHANIAIVLHGDCIEAQNFLIKCGKLKYFSVKYHWLIISSFNNFTLKFDKVILNIDADIFLALKLESDNWEIYDVYNPASEHGGFLNVTKIGNYQQNKLEIKIEKTKYWSRKNTTGVTFRSLIVLPVKFEGTLENYLKSDDNRDINTFNRMHFRLVQFCQDFYNFSLELYQTPSWGYTNPDGTFDGIVGALEHKTIDFGSSPLFFRTDRHKVIDYGRNTWILRAAFLFQDPKAPTSFQVFLQPLSTSIWIITGLLAVLAIIILKIVTTFELKKYNIIEETSWSISVLFALGAFCQQGAASTPRLTCGRITTISIFLLSLIVYQFYSASLVSSLLLKPTTNIKTLGELLESPLKAGCEDILYNRDYFQHTTDKVAIKLYNQKIIGKLNTSNFLTPEKGLVSVEKGGYAFHVELATAYPIIESTFKEEAICDLREIQLFNTQPMHANYQKKSPFKDMMDVCFQKMAEHGILQRERKHWHPRKPECIPSAKSISFNVGLDELYPALVGLSIGIAASLMVLLIEIHGKMHLANLFNYYTENKKKTSLYPYVP